MTKSKRIFISNRLPFSIDAKTGELKQGSGGLVSALLGVSLDDPFIWMGFETDEESANKLSQNAKKLVPNLTVKPVVLDKKLYESYYDRFCNDVLWPLFHYEGQHAFFRRNDWQSYITANKKMAEQILKVAGPHDTIWIHDFHFLLLPEYLKQGNPNLKVGLFLHTPFPSSEIFRQLPVREEILRALIRCDLIGFHEHSYLRHFTVALKAHLGVDSSFFKAQIADHTLQLGVYPISVDTQKWMKKAKSEKIIKDTENLSEKIQSPFLVLGVDRLDYTKGIELKLRGFRRLLQKCPDLRGQISLLQVAVPTRVKVPSYIRLKKEIDQLVGMINGEFGQPGYTPVNYIFNSLSEDELLALYKRAECVLITSKRDGMNLVAIEYAIAQEQSDPGVLVLSEFAGAASLLGQALIINPWDEDSIADAVEKAYRMPIEEKSERVKGLQAILSKYSATQWAISFLKDLDEAQLAPAKKPVIRLESNNHFQHGDLFERILEAKNCHIVMDYDGTLVGIKMLPEQATLQENQKLLLKNLSAQFSVHILSGRSRAFLDQQFSDSKVCLAAEHGAYYRSYNDDWKSRVSSDIQSWFPEVTRAMKAYSDTVPLSFVEVKEASIVWHFRQSPTDFAEFRAKKLDEELQVGLANQPVTVTIGSKIVEAKAVECNKGSFLRWLMDSENTPEDTLFICIGDDRTDEDMFKILENKGISVKVGPGATAAHYRLAKQEDVLSFLNEILIRKENAEKFHKRPPQFERSKAFLPL